LTKLHNLDVQGFSK